VWTNSYIQFKKKSFFSLDFFFQFKIKANTDLFEKGCALTKSWVSLEDVYVQYGFNEQCVYVSSVFHSGIILQKKGYLYEYILQDMWRYA
jgi:hypothetical protein